MQTKLAEALLCFDGSSALCRVEFAPYRVAFRDLALHVVDVPQQPTGLPPGATKQATPQVFHVRPLVSRFFGGLQRWFRRVDQVRLS